MSERPVLWIDTETTALGPHRRIWELALITDDWERLYVLEDVNLGMANSKSLAMNGFHQRHPRGSDYQPSDVAIVLPEREVAGIVHTLTKGATIVAAIPEFDLVPLAAMLYRHRLEPEWHHRTRDVESMTEGYLRRREIGGLQACADALGIERDRTQAHSALGDARLVRECWKVIHQR